MAAYASAQLPLPSTGITFHAGYTTSNSFTKSDGSTGRLRGLELGAELPIFKLPAGFSLNAYPSVLTSSGNTKGTVVRVLGSAHQTVPGAQFYLLFGAGFSFASGSDFSDQTSFETMVGGGLPLAAFAGRLSPSLEVAFHNSNSAQVRGFTVGLSASF